jgi:tRNA/rRNA methyltransferase
MPDLKPTKRQAAARTAGGAPAIILVEPQLGENIGMAARAMLNFGLIDLRLVRPRGKWPNARAIAASSGAHAVLEAARVFDTTQEAVADLHRLAATTARLRDMIKDVASPRDWTAAIRLDVAKGLGAGILFGPERMGLHNDDIALADTLVTVPTNPAFSSINLAQTVLLLGYEWHVGGGAEAPKVILRKGWGSKPATQADLAAFYGHLEEELDRCGFLRVTEKRARMVRNIRNIFNRNRLTDQEVRTLRGIVVCLTTLRRKKEKSEP